MEAFNSHIQRTKAALEQQELNPMTALRDTLIKVVYDNNIRAKTYPCRRVRVAHETMTRALEIYKQRFADADDFTFFFVGDPRC